MAEFRNQPQRIVGTKKIKLQTKATNINKALSSAVKKKYGISDFTIRESYFSGKPARVFEGKRMGAMVLIYKPIGSNGYSINVTRGKREVLALANTLPEALEASKALSVIGSRKKVYRSARKVDKKRMNVQGR